MFILFLYFVLIFDLFLGASCSVQNKYIFFLSFKFFFFISLVHTIHRIGTVINLMHLRRCCLGGGSPSECGSKSPSSIEASDSTLELDSKLRLRGASCVSVENISLIGFFFVKYKYTHVSFTLKGLRYDLGL